MRCVEVRRRPVRQGSYTCCWKILTFRLCYMCLRILRLDKEGVAKIVLYLQLSIIRKFPLTSLTVS